MLITTKFYAVCCNFSHPGLFWEFLSAQRSWITILLWSPIWLKNRGLFHNIQFPQYIIWRVVLCYYNPQYDWRVVSSTNKSSTGLCFTPKFSRPFTCSTERLGAQLQCCPNAEDWPMAPGDGYEFHTIFKQSQGDSTDMHYYLHIYIYILYCHSFTYAYTHAHTHHRHI